jgi:hypothetical protein
LIEVVILINNIFIQSLAELCKKLDSIATEEDTNKPQCIYTDEQTCKEGPLQIKELKSWKERWCALEDNARLALYRNPKVTWTVIFNFLLKGKHRKKHSWV